MEISPSQSPSSKAAQTHTQGSVDEGASLDIFAAIMAVQMPIAETQQHHFFAAPAQIPVDLAVDSDNWNEAEALLVNGQALPVGGDLPAGAALQSLAHDWAASSPPIAGVAQPVPVPEGQERSAQPMRPSVQMPPVPVPAPTPLAALSEVSQPTLQPTASVLPSAPPVAAPANAAPPNTQWLSTLPEMKVTSALAGLRSILAAQQSGHAQTTERPTAPQDLINKAPGEDPLTASAAPLLRKPIADALRVAINGHAGEKTPLVMADSVVENAHALSRVQSRSVRPVPGAVPGATSEATVEVSDVAVMSAISARSNAYPVKIQVTANAVQGTLKLPVSELPDAIGSSLFDAERLAQEFSGLGEMPADDMDIDLPKTAAPLSHYRMPLPGNADEMTQALRARVHAMLGEGVQRAQISIDPDGMGHIDINVELEEGQHLRIAVATETSPLKELVEAALPRLRDALAERGYQGAGIDVAVDAGRQQREQSQQDEAKGQSYAQQEVEVPTTEGETGVRPSSSGVLSAYV